MTQRSALLAVFAGVWLVTGCRYFRMRENPEPVTDTTVVATAEIPVVEPPRGSGVYSDATIAAMVLASSNTDISYARIAEARSTREDVKAYARRMLADHAGINSLLRDLLDGEDIAPVENVESLALREESADMRERMRMASGYGLDSLYIENEVSFHRRFLFNVDNLMIPRARGEKLRNFLTVIRPAVAAHLSHAEQVRSDVLAKR